MIICKEPLGYEIRDKKFIIVEDEAELINRIFNLYISRYGYRNIANLLDKESVPTPSMMIKKRKLSNGEKDFLLQARRGEALFRFNRESYIARVESSEFEHELITSQLPTDLKGSNFQ